jgi:hypothetical protein
MAKESGGNQTCRSVISMRVSMKWTRSMAKVFFNGRVETFTRGTTLMMKDTAMVKCTGLTGQYTEGNG